MANSKWVKLYKMAINDVSWSRSHLSNTSGPLNYFNTLNFPPNPSKMAIFDDFCLQVSENRTPVSGHLSGRPKKIFFLFPTKLCFDPCMIRIYLSFYEATGMLKPWKMAKYQKITPKKHFSFKPKFGSFAVEIGKKRICIVEKLHFKGFPKKASEFPYHLPFSR